MKKIIAIVFAVTMPIYAGIILGLSSRGPFPNLASISFNGTTQYISAPTNAAINPDYNTPFWISFWIKTTQATGSPTLISNLNAGGTRGLYIFMSAGKISCGLFSTGAIAAYWSTTTTTVNNGNWHHVAISYTGGATVSSFTEYIDGVSAALTTNINNLGTGSTTTTTNVSIGADLVGGAEDFFSGNLNQFAFKRNATLTSGNVTAIYGPGLASSLTPFAPGVWLYLAAISGFNTVDTITSNGLIDRGTAGMNFSPTAMTSANIVQNTNTNFYGRQSIKSNGSTTLFNAGTGATIQPEYTDPFSFFFWMYVDKSSLGSDISFMGNSPANSSPGWNIVADASPARRMQFEFDALPSSGSNFFGIEGNAGDIPLQTWFSLGGSNDGSNSPNALKAYLNGALISTTTYGAASLTGSIKGSPLTFMGQGTGLGQPFQGYGYNPSYWNSALTAADFAALHANGPLVSPSALSSYVSHCVSFWPMKSFNLGITSGTVLDIKGTNNATVTNGLFSTSIPQ